MMDNATAALLAAMMIFSLVAALFAGVIIGLNL